MLCVFFFQAEDGIRGRLVTGVQTCALPIYFKESWIFSTTCQLCGGRVATKKATCMKPSFPEQFFFFLLSTQKYFFRNRPKEAR